MKYELTNESINHLGKTLYRIKALKDFNNVKKGDLGGYIEKESNLSQEYNAWVSGNAKVFGNAMVYGYARVYDNAMVYGDARVYDNARVSGNAKVYGNAMVYGDARVYDNARVHGNARVSGNARVFGNAEVYGNAWVRNFDEIKDINNIMNILGLEYSITVTPTSINIGCRSYTFDQLDTVFNDDEYDDNEDIPIIKGMIELAIDRIIRKI